MRKTQSPQIPTTTIVSFLDNGLAVNAKVAHASSANTNVVTKRRREDRMILAVKFLEVCCTELGGGDVLAP